MYIMKVKVEFIVCVEVRERMIEGSMGIMFWLYGCGILDVW